MIRVHVLKIPEAESVDKPEMNKYTIKLTFVWFLSPPLSLSPSLPPSLSPHLALSPSPSLSYALSVFPYTVPSRKRAHGRCT